MVGKQDHALGQYTQACEDVPVNLGTGTLDQKRWTISGSNKPPGAIPQQPLGIVITGFVEMMGRIYFKVGSSRSIPFLPGRGYIAKRLSLVHKKFAAG
jgi:hypothetical protein